jgi:citrate lyase gamma subunit
MIRLNTFPMWLSAAMLTMFLVNAPVHISVAEKTRTIVADLLMVDGNFYVVRGERGEIRIEVTDKTTLSETFTFGDRIKAVILPNDQAVSIVRATPGDPIGMTRDEPGETQKDQTPPPPAAPPPSSPEGPQREIPSDDPSKKSAQSQAVDPAPAPDRIIVADLLMIDGNFYIVRTERGEVQIEITPQTQLSEKFQFGDRIKALVKPNDAAISVERATVDEPAGIRRVPPAASPAPDTKTPSSPTPLSPSEHEQRATAAPSSEIPPQARIIVAEILMVDGDFYVVRGERGEIRIEITPQTKLAEQFEFGDTIKAVVLPNDKAVSVERAGR